MSTAVGCDVAAVAATRCERGDSTMKAEARSAKADG
jgi:hypothetical protein